MSVTIVFYCWKTLKSLTRKVASCWLEAQKNKYFSLVLLKSSRNSLHHTSHCCFTFRLTIHVVMIQYNVICINVPHPHQRFLSSSLWSPSSRTFDLEEEGPFPEDSSQNLLTAAQNTIFPSRFFGSTEAAMRFRFRSDVNGRPGTVDETTQAARRRTDVNLVWRGKTIETRGGTHVSQLVCVYCGSASNVCTVARLVCVYCGSGCQRQMWVGSVAAALSYKPVMPLHIYSVLSLFR